MGVENFSDFLRPHLWQLQGVVEIFFSIHPYSKQFNIVSLANWALPDFFLIYAHALMIFPVGSSCILSLLGIRDLKSVLYPKNSLFWVSAIIYVLNTQDFVKYRHFYVKCDYFWVLKTIFSSVYPIPPVKGMQCQLFSYSNCFSK